MRIAFKSLVILSQTSNSFGSTTRTTTVYDLHTVRDHTLDIPAWRLLFHWGIPWRVGLFALLPIFLLLIWTGGAPQDHPLLVAGFLVPWCSLFYFLAYLTVKTQEMERLARRERGLIDKTQLGVVENQQWEAFVSDLEVSGNVRETELTRMLNPSGLGPIAPSPRRVCSICGARLGEQEKSARLCRSCQRRSR